MKKIKATEFEKAKPNFSKNSNSATFCLESSLRTLRGAYLVDVFECFVFNNDVMIDVNEKNNAKSFKLNYSSVLKVNNPNRKFETKLHVFG